MHHIHHIHQPERVHNLTTSPPLPMSSHSFSPPATRPETEASPPPAVVCDEIGDDGRKTNPREAEGGDQNANRQGGLALEPGPETKDQGPWCDAEPSHDEQSKISQKSTRALKKGIFTQTNPLLI